MSHFEYVPASLKTQARPLSKRRIFLIESHPITRDGFGHLIDFQPDLEVCGHASSPSEALKAIDAAKPDAVVADLSFSGASRFDFLKDLKLRHPRLPVLVFSAYDESLYAERAMRAGARGYLMKHTPTSQVMNAIRRVLDGELYLSDQMRSRLLHRHLGNSGPEHAEMESLTDRELEIFQLIGRGYTTRRIASTLHLSVSTVETHRAHIKEKLSLKNAVELVRRAVECANGH